MTTLAEDRDSWKASGIIRRDFRHTHGDPEVPRHRRRRTRAERKGCHGQAGRPHTPAWVRTSPRMLTHVCSRCGKHVGWAWIGGRW